MSNFNQFRQELQMLGLSTQADLASLVKPLILNTIKLSLDQSNDRSKNTQFLSQFGGYPYFEVGESWPITTAGKPLDFIFQIVNLENIDFFRDLNIQVIQFYYNWDSFAWETKQEGWVIKTYKHMNREKSLLIEKPAELKARGYCNIILSEAKTLPDWESIKHYQPLASKLSYILNEDEPWTSYQEVVEELIGESENPHFSRIGGYPSWLQGDSTPFNTKGTAMKLLFQLDSEEKTQLMWGDCGCIYAFYDPHNFNHFEFELQCY
jgi:uncharacterized protein YwqG